MQNLNKQSWIRSTKTLIPLFLHMARPVLEKRIQLLVIAQKHQHPIMTINML